MTGAFDAIDFRGIDNHSLLDEWKDGPRTFLGITVEHFPNMFMSMGPHQAYGNIPRSIEFAVGWIAETIEYCRDHDISYIEATDASVRIIESHRQLFADKEPRYGNGPIMSMIWVRTSSATRSTLG